MHRPGVEDAAVNNIITTDKMGVAKLKTPNLEEGEAIRRRGW